MLRRVYKNESIGNCIRFRTAIEEAVKCGEIREMASFPCGCCSFASDLLQRYLIEKYDFFTWYMSGQYGYGWDGESHAWLETINHRTVIDITGDQYKYKELKFTEPVYIGPREDGFHNAYRLDKPIPYTRYDDPFGGNRAVDKRYEVVIRHLRNR